MSTRAHPISHHVAVLPLYLGFSCATLPGAPRIRPATLEYLLSNGFPTTFTVFGKDRKKRVYPKGTRTLMDACIIDRSPKLCDVCHKFRIPPSQYSLNKWKTQKFMWPINKHLRREQCFQTFKHFMVLCMKNDLMPLETIKEIMELYVRAEHEVLVI